MAKLSQDEKFARAVVRYAAARIELEDMGSIPVMGQDAAEQRLIDETRTQIKREHTAAWNAVMKFAPSKIKDL